MTEKQKYVKFVLFFILLFSLASNFYKTTVYQPSASYTIYNGAIIIRNNGQFQSLATANGWPGDGLTEATAYIINDLKIVNADYEMIVITDTTAYFKVQNCLLHYGGDFNYDPILLRNVQNGEFSGNIIAGGRHGIGMTACSNMKFIDNDIYDMWESAMRVNSSSYLEIRSNEIWNITYNGIWVNNSMNLEIDSNELYDIYNPIWLMEGSADNNITSNTIHDTVNGIWLSNSSNNCNVYLNLINRTACGGIIISDNTSNVNVGNNTVINCTQYGIALTGSSSSNNVTYNSFVDNYFGGTSQGIDNGTSNIIEYNFWDEWISPDGDSNGIVDLPYILDGTALNIDPYPLTTPNQPIGVHYITEPLLIYPIGDEIINGTKLIQWTAAFDSYYHPILYNVSYCYNSSTWDQIGSGLTETNVLWNTKTTIDGSNYQIRVEAYCSQGFIRESISGQFTIFNHYLISVPTIITPISGSTINETFQIEWNPVVDNLGHAIFYNISVRYNHSFWVQIAAGVSETSFDWNTKTTQDGSGYQIQVIAYCDYGLVEEAISDYFTIKHTPTQPVSGFPRFWFYIIGGVAGVTIAGLSVGIVMVKKRRTRQGNEPLPNPEIKYKPKPKPKAEERVKPQEKVESETKSENESKIVTETDKESET